MNETTLKTVIVTQEDIDEMKALIEETIEEGRQWYTGEYPRQGSGMSDTDAEPDHEQRFSMASQSYGDAGDFAHLMSLALQGRNKEAKDHAQSLDTAAREEIPHKLWDKLQAF